MSSGRLPSALKSLSARLLVLTVFFVMLAEVLTYVPSIARFRMTELKDRLQAAHLAVISASDSQGLSASAESAMLRDARVYAVKLQRPDGTELELGIRGRADPAETYDLRKTGLPDMVGNAFGTLFGSGDRLLRVIGPAPGEADGVLTIDLDESPLRHAMIDYSERILALSLVISIFTATLVYVALTLLMVRPMRRLTDSMTHFREDPENPGSVIRASGRDDEIGTAETELASMQERLTHALNQKERMAALGVAVTKINHDLKNILATARLVSDRMSDSEDPEVARMAPRLVKTIDRAVNLCVQTLTYAREGPAELDLADVDLRALVTDVANGLPVASADQVTVESELPEGVTVLADREQLYRVFANIAQNAIEAGATRLRVHGGRSDGRLLVRISDNGPGLPPAVRESVFQPFETAGKSGSSGLGLAIARDLVHDHGGEISVERTSGEGTVFRIELPAGQHRAAGGQTVRRAAAR